MSKEKKSQKVKVQATKKTDICYGPQKKKYSAKEIAEAWTSFKPDVPIGYSLASSKAARTK